jgi:C4-dicarboxylate-specific signal transduction histidine kinase
LVSAEVVLAFVVVVVLDEKDGQTTVSVRDTGIGIASEIYINLFIKFTIK